MYYNNIAEMCNQAGPRIVDNCAALGYTFQHLAG
jgi:hypothetical protein